MLAIDDPFETIDRLIEEVQEQLDACLKAEQVSQAAILGGTLILALVLTFATTYRTPVVVFGAFTAVLGGMVWLGANRSTRAELEGRRADLDTQKARLIDQVAARNGWRDMTSTVH